MRVQPKNLSGRMKARRFRNEHAPLLGTLRRGKSPTEDVNEFLLLTTVSYECASRHSQSVQTGRALAEVLWETG